MKKPVLKCMKKQREKETKRLKAVVCSKKSSKNCEFFCLSVTQRVRRGQKSTFLDLGVGPEVNFIEKRDGPERGNFWLKKVS